jgi:hypothetical protein
MDKFVTPADFNDGYTDLSREHHKEAILNIYGQMTPCRYHAGKMGWYRIDPIATATPQITVYISSSVTSSY